MSHDQRRASDGGRFKKPPLRVFTTTLWEYPSQHYESANAPLQGDPNYTGATPSWVIWQVLTRYTRDNDLILDPMCGSGTTLDVCKDLSRRGLGFDLAPRRPDIQHADARELPIEDSTADFVFIDPPYSTHIDYSDDPRCIGKLDAGEEPADSGPSARHDESGGATDRADHTARLNSAGDDDRDDPATPERTGAEYYDAMEEVIAECHRVLKNRRYLALYVSDSWKKRRGEPGAGGGQFMPIGFELFSILRDYFEPIDIIAVVRHNQKLARGNWHKAAEEQNFFLRGFNYLFIMKKTEPRA